MKLKKNKRKRETSCKKRNAILAKFRIRSDQLAKRKAYHCVDQATLCVLSKIRLLICYIFVFQSVTHILGEIYKIDIKFTLFTFTI